MFVNPSPRCSAIPLSGVLRDPDATEDPFIEIRGQVVSSLNCEPSTNHTLVDVGLTMKAEIKPLLTDSVKWRLSGKSVDRINVCDVSEEGTAVLDKSYPVEGRGDGLQLHLKFQITPSRIELAAVWFDHCTTAQRSNQTNDSN
jgi:Tfp pilus tip-associated adhesin PilY1